MSSKGGSISGGLGRAPYPQAAGKNGSAWALSPLLTGLRTMSMMRTAASCAVRTAFLAPTLRSRALRFIEGVEGDDVAIGATDGVARPLLIACSSPPRPIASSRR